MQKNNSAPQHSLNVLTFYVVSLIAFVEVAHTL
jgi:hypothetical protein